MEFLNSEIIQFRKAWLYVRNKPARKAGIDSHLLLRYEQAQVFHHANYRPRIRRMPLIHKAQSLCHYGIRLCWVFHPCSSAISYQVSSSHKTRHNAPYHAIKSKSLLYQRQGDLPFNKVIKNKVKDRCAILIIFGLMHLMRL